MDSGRLITALILNDLRNSGDSEAYEIIVENTDAESLLVGSQELINVLLRIAAKARGMTVNEMVSTLFLTAVDLSREQRQ